jgi:hypothetical protein
MYRSIAMDGVEMVAAGASGGKAPQTADVHLFLRVDFGKGRTTPSRSG